ncbi:hypothetical protein ZIOFF_025167 [Zingiber officinale]|uniref:Deoxyuridine 5'-triphosphate nucleotidohydrolase n=1 Tax=Zingiber officinale TaxID=94328 RepID=A0A8J5HA38_ZINOF|nr:hypothetical protein ZIOFF_025167 [Zingiber officinale]
MNGGRMARQISLITRGLVVRLSNTPNVRFAYEVQEVDIPTNPEIEGTDYPYLLVHKLSPFAVTPARKSTGVAGLDLAASEDCIIQPRGQGLISTGLIREIPWGTYGRIATRSSATFRLGLDIGAGVIVYVYRREIKILAFSHSDQFIYIYIGDCVAQLILEYIAIPKVYEVQSITPTSRGTKGFGSTTPISPDISRKEPKAQWDTLGELSGATSPGATVLRSMEIAQDDSEDDFFHQIQYMASLTQSMLMHKEDSYNHQEEDFINPFASEGGRDELLATGYEMDYPSLQSLLKTPQEQIYSTSTVISPYNPPQESAMGTPGIPQH